MYLIISLYVLKLAAWRDVEEMPKRSQSPHQSKPITNRTASCWGCWAVLNQDHIRANVVKICQLRDDVAGKQYFFGTATGVGPLYAYVQS